MKLKVIATGAAVAAVALIPATSAGAAQYAHPKLHHWYAKQGGKQAISHIITDQQAISNDASSSNSAAVGTDCQNLRNDTQIALSLPPMPMSSAERLWVAAMGDYQNGAVSCVNGINDNSVGEIDVATSDFTSGTALVNHLATELGA